MRVEGSLEMLGNVCAVSRGTTITQKDAVEGPIPVVAGGLEPTYFHNRANRPPGIITVSGSGANAGYINYWPVPIFASDCSTVIPRDTEQLDVRYVFFALKSLQDFVSTELRHGAAQPHVYAKDIAQLRIFVPPISEQQRLVALLDEAFDSIAVAKASAEQNLKNARALFDSHLETVFSQRGEGWVETTLDKLSANLDNERVPITRNVRASGEYPYYGASGIVDYVADYIFDGDMLLVSEDGANLLARSTPIAFSVSGKCWVNNHAHILKFKHLATQRFVELYLGSIKLDDYITGAAQPKLNQKALNSIPIPIPKSVERQAEIGGKFDILATETQRLEAIYQRKIAALEELKKTLLFQAFAGEL